MLLSSQRVSCRTVDASHSGKGVAYMRTPSRTTRFASLLQRNLDRFRRYAHNLRNGKEISRTAETMDAIQDASVDFLRRPRKIKSTTHFNNLFKGFIRNALGDRRKKDNALKRGGGSLSIRAPGYRIVKESVLLMDWMPRGAAGLSVRKALWIVRPIQGAAFGMANAAFAVPAASRVPV